VEDNRAIPKTIDFGVAKAKQLYLQIPPVQRRMDGDEHGRTLRPVRGLAVVYKEQARSEQAEPLLLEAVEGRRLQLGDKHPRTIEPWNNPIDLFDAWNKGEQANEWRTKLSTARQSPQ
jgi:hypothetical protein